MGAHVRERPRRERLGRGVVVLAAALVLGLLASGGLILQSTQAVFSATTTNASNTWQAGSVSLDDDDSGAAMFTSSTAFVPGQTAENCIQVSYGGDVTSAVRLYASAVADPDGLAQYVDLVLEQGSGGGFGSCAGFTKDSGGAGDLYSGTLSAFTTSQTSYATGVSTWSPTGAGQTKVYRFEVGMQSGTPQSAQGGSASATFTWQARAGT